MNKKIIVFICILSLLIPLFPVFQPVFYAADSVSDDNPSQGGGGGHHHDNSYSGWLGQINEDLIENGWIIRNPDELILDWLDEWNIIEGYDNAEEQFNNLVETNPDIITSLTVSVNNALDSYIQDNQSYYIYRTMPVSTFFSYFVFTKPDADGMRELATFRNWVIPFVNNQKGISMLYCNYYIWAHDTFVVTYGDLLDNYSFCLQTGSFGDFPNLPYQTYVVEDSSGNNPVGINPMDGELSLYSNEFFDSYNGQFTSYRGYNGTVSSNSSNDFAYVGFLQNGYYASWHCFAQGSLYLTPDSVGSVSFVVFRSSADMQLFYTGRSNVYRFDKNVDIPTGSNIDYSNLFNQVSHAIAENGGNVIDAINNAANNYLAEQVELLGDISNALNDETGRSWLRRIYNLLEIQFPEVIDAIQEIQITGGSADMAQTNAILSQINEKLGFLIDQPFEDMDNSDFESMRDACGRKFPFCIFSDIVAISVILNRPPIEPDINIPIPLGSASMNYVHIDLEPYEYVRPYVHGGIIFLFIIGLLALSVKVFDSVKG